MNPNNNKALFKLLRLALEHYCDYSDHTGKGLTHLEVDQDFKEFMNQDKIKILITDATVEAQLQLSTYIVPVFLFNESLTIMRDLAEHQCEPLVRHEKEYTETMNKVWEFLNFHEPRMKNLNQIFNPSSNKPTHENNS